MSERDEAIDAMREACAGWPQPNHYDRALDALLAELEQAEKREAALREFVELVRDKSQNWEGDHAEQVLAALREPSNE